MTREELENIFTYHMPINDQATRYVSIRETALVLAHAINKMCPDSREKSLAITSVQQAVMWANASIAINESES